MQISMDGLFYHQLCFSCDIFLYQNFFFGNPSYGCRATFISTSNNFQAVVSRVGLYHSSILVVFYRNLCIYTCMDYFNTNHISVGVQLTITFCFLNRKFGRRVILIQLTKCNNVIIEPQLLLWRIFWTMGIEGLQIHFFWVWLRRKERE